MSSPEKTNIERALEYLRQNAEQITDPYTQALCANAFYLWEQSDSSGAAAQPNYQIFLNRLQETKIVEADRCHWNAETASLMNSRGTTADLEVTALAGNAFAVTKSNPQLTAAVANYLHHNRLSYGTWGSTQATILTLKLLIDQAGITARQFDILVNQQLARQIVLDSDENFAAVQVDLKENLLKGENTISVKSPETDQVDCQIVVESFQPWENSKWLSGKLEVAFALANQKFKVGEAMNGRLTLRNTEKVPLGMVVARVNLPAYCQVFKTDLAQLLQENQIDRYEINGQQLVLYLKQMGPEQTWNIDLRFCATAPLKASGFFADVYEYYQPANQSCQAPVQVVVVAE